MNPHVKIVAVLHILGGVLGLIAAVVIFTVFGVASGIVIWQGQHEAATAASIIGIVALVIGGFLALLALPGIIGGCGLLAQKEWAKVLVIVLGVLHLVNFPFGTALGIYTLWALLKTPVPQ